jgi:competence protein ComEA
VTAQKIIDFRTAHSGFTSVAQLQQVSGIGPATYAELAPLVTP